MPGRIGLVGLVAVAIVFTVASFGCNSAMDPVADPGDNPPTAKPDKPPIARPDNPADQPAEPPIELSQQQANLAAACKYLWNQQAEDGGWHSQQYGLLKSGQALTPFVLHALLNVPEAVYPRSKQAVDRALEFIRQHAREDGALGYADAEVLEYPNYATSYALRCLLKAGATDDAELIDKMSRYLQGQQYTDARGFTTDDAAFGGWGFGGEQPPGKTGHMDLAHTRCVLEAIIDAGAAPAVFERAEHFLRYVQRHPDDPRLQPRSAGEASPDNSKSTFDGGFYFSPVVLSANKAPYVELPDGGYFPSYATATCDGLLALLAAGVARDDQRIETAFAWLTDHPGLERPAGIPQDHPEPWAEALFFYHLAARGEVYALMSWPEGARAEMLKILSNAQQDDGSFRNLASPLQKEDDPLIATSLAVTALTHALAGR